MTWPSAKTCLKLGVTLHFIDLRKICSSSLLTQRSGGSEGPEKCPSYLQTNSHEIQAWISAQACAALGFYSWSPVCPLNMLIGIPLCAAEFLKNI